MTQRPDPILRGQPVDLQPGMVCAGNRNGAMDAYNLPTRLALEWEGRVAFTLTEGLQIKGITYLDGVFDDQPDDADGFDTDVTIATGELRKLIPDLVEALGGELVEGGAS